MASISTTAPGRRRPEITVERPAAPPEVALVDRVVGRRILGAGEEGGHLHHVCQTRPASASTAERFSSACTVWAVTSSPASFRSLLMPSCPEQKMKSPLMIAGERKARSEGANYGAGHGAFLSKAMG